VRFAANMPRLITTQQMPEDWLSVLSACCDVKDTEAVLKRVAFVHVNEALVPPTLVDRARGDKTASLVEAFAAVGVNCTHSGTLGGWAA